MQMRKTTGAALSTIHSLAFVEEQCNIDLMHTVYEKTRGAQRNPLAGVPSSEIGGALPRNVMSFPGHKYRYA
jgi:hypothetical protein